MPRLVQNSFAGGEIDPAVYGLVNDGSIARAGCRFLQNYLITQGGTALRRGGFKYVAEVNDSSKATILHRFTIPGTGHYVVEMSEGALRFYKYSSGVPTRIESGGSPVEVTSGWIYTESELPDIRVVADGEDLWIFHPDHQPRKLTYTSDTSWAVSRVDFGEKFPSLKERGRNITITPSSDTAGVFRQLTASESLFPTASSANNDIYYVNNGFFQINPALSTPTVAQGTNLADTPDSTEATTDWTYYEEDTAGGDTGINITFDTAAIGVETSLSASGALFTDSNVGRILDVDRSAGNTYLVLVTSVTDSTNATGYPIKTALTAGIGTDSRWWIPDDPLDGITLSVSSVDVGTGVTLTASADYFDSSMVRTATEPGAFFGFLGGYCEVTAYSSAQSVTVEVLDAFTSAAPSVAWRESWSVSKGFPRFGFIHQSRLGCLDVSGAARTFWLSATNEFDEFKPVVNRDDSGFGFRISEANGSLIWAYSAGDLLIGSEDLAARISAVPISQSNFGADTQTRIGAGRVAPVLAGNEVLFAGRDLRRLYGMSYSDAVGKYLLPERSYHWNHLIGADIKQVAYMQEPQRVCFVLLTDGTPIAYSYDQLNEINGASRVTIGGSATVDSIAVLPGTSGDDLWIVAKRTINGATKRYVEVYSASNYTDSFIEEGDLTITATSISGLSHLEAAEVYLRLDGVYRSNPSGAETFTVTSGAVDISGLNLSGAPTTVEVGLGYEDRITLAPTPFQTAEGASLGSTLSISGARVLVKDTLGLGDYDPANSSYFLLPAIGREESDEIGSAPPLYQGWAEIGGSVSVSDEEDPTVSFGGTSPLPRHILAVTMDVEAA